MELFLTAMVSGTSTVSDIVKMKVTQSWLILGDPMDCSMPGFPVHHQLPELTQTHVNRVSDAIQPFHPLLPLLLLPSILPSNRAKLQQPPIVTPEGVQDDKTQDTGPR